MIFKTLALLAITCAGVALVLFGIYLFCRFMYNAFISDSETEKRELKQLRYETQSEADRLESLLNQLKEKANTI